MTHTRKHSSIMLWPFVALWNLIALSVGLTGRLVVVVLTARLMRRRRLSSSALDA